MAGMVMSACRCRSRCRTGMPMMPGLVGTDAGRRRRFCRARASIRKTLPAAKPSADRAAQGRRHARSHRDARAAHDQGTLIRDVRLQRPGARTADSRAAERDDHGALSQSHRSAEHGALARRAARQPVRRRSRTDAGLGRRRARTSSTPCIFPTPASTGITRTCAKTSSRRWGCSATCSSTRRTETTTRR